MATRTIAIANRKGGVGKTTTAINLGAGLAMLHYKVCIVDLDSQANVSLSFGVDVGRSLYEVLVQGVAASSCLYLVRENLEILPSTEKLAEAKEILTSRRKREEILAKALRDLKGYDFIILDCAPSLDTLNLNALVASDEVIVPISCDYLAAEGARAHLSNVRELIAEGYELRLSLVVPTFFDQRNRKSHEISLLLKEHFGNIVTDPIRTNVKLAEAPSFRKTIFEYDPQSYGAMDYGKLVTRVARGR
jgi:chromosome partitioning protein